MKEIKNVISALKRHKKFLVTSHINSEGDSIGSQVAMALLLKKLGKKYIIVDSDPIPHTLKFLLDGETIKTDLRKTDTFDAIIAVDCPVIERTGRVAGYFKRAKEIINIDHHVSNSLFGDAVWVAPNMSSCGEMLYHLYKNLNIKIDMKAALAMYVAIVTDTGYFSYENTTYETHKVVADLLKAGVRSLWVGKQLNEKKSVNELKLLTAALNTLKLYDNGRVAALYTSKQMLERLNVGPQSAEGFVNYGRSIDTVKVAIFFLQRPNKSGEVHISFRSKGEVDVNKLARIFNGGGHPNASGCVIKGSIAHAMKIVLPKVKQFLK